ncbi:MAG: GTP pyrophosphokinase family protein [Acidimicrobiia bacterium]
MGPQAKAFLERYRAEFSSLAERAQLLERYLARLLSPGNYDLHTIVARAKEPDSVRAKILRKRYGHPARQLTDRLGARVIVYFSADVDRVATDLRALLDVDHNNSSDKRASLGLREFGYRSVHLVAKPKGMNLGMEFDLLKDQRFEVQIRSVLEHAWAEIEHEVVYKAGLSANSEERRRFSAIAGTLELLEKEFSALREYRNEVIGRYVTQMQQGAHSVVMLDAPWLLATLEVMRPDGLSWRAAELSGSPFPPRIEAECVQALARVGIENTAQLRAALEAQDFQDVLARYAVATGAVPSQVSHLITSILMVAQRDPGVAEDFFPTIAAAPEVQAGIYA